MRGQRPEGSALCESRPFCSLPEETQASYDTQTYRQLNLGLVSSTVRNELLSQLPSLKYFAIAAQNTLT